MRSLSGTDMEVIFRALQNLDKNPPEDSDLVECSDARRLSNEFKEEIEKAKEDPRWPYVENWFVVQNP